MRCRAVPRVCAAACRDMPQRRPTSQWDTVDNRLHVVVFAYDTMNTLNAASRVVFGCVALRSVVNAAL